MTASRPRVGTTLVAATLTGAAGMTRLLAGGVAGRAGGSIAVAALVGTVLPGALARIRWSKPVSAVVSTGAVLLVATWTTAGAATRWGLPTATTARVLGSDLGAAHRVLAKLAVPVPAVPGVAFLAALLVGEAGLAGRLLLDGRAGDRRGVRPALALLPSLGLVAWSVAAMPGWGSAALVAAYAAVAGATVLLGDRWPHRAGARGQPLGSVVSLGFAAAAMTFGATAAAGIPVAGATAPTGTGPGAPTALRASSLALSTDLVAVERRDPDMLLFTAVTPVPTYWQVATLTRFEHDRWVPGPRTSAALHGTVPPDKGAGPGAGTPNGTYAANVTLRGLTGRLVPVPPSTVAVAGDANLTMTGVGAVAATPAGAGTVYTAFARTPRAVGPGPGPPAGRLPASLAGETALPPLPPVVAALARRVVAAVAPTPLARAEALVDWFRSGAFGYTLTPPAAPAGTDPLVAFLTTTRAGSCEEFAGAFAVMARSLGLPTRVAVGFTAGEGGATTVTEVRGMDAHAWPEVYLGPSLGWVSFEPTPALPAGEMTPPGVVGRTGISTGPTATALPATTRPVPVAPPTTAPSNPPVGAPTDAAGAGTAGAGTPGFLARLVGIAALLVVGASLGALFVVSRRRRRRRHASAAVRVVGAWGTVDHALRRCGMPRPASRSPSAHGELLARAVERLAASGAPDRSPAADTLAAAVRDVVQSALLVERTCFAAEPVDPRDAVRAEALALAVRRALRSPSVRSCCREVRVERGARAGTPA